MKKVIITAILSVAVGIAGGWILFRSSDPSPAARKILYYRDPMNPAMTSHTPKKAPDGMDYVPVYDEGSSAGAQRKIAYWKDPMHPWYTSDKPGKAPDCGMDLVPVYEGETDATGIRIDPTTVQNIGVKTEVVQVRNLHRIIRTVGKIQYDETRVYAVNSKIAGWVEKLRVDYTGQFVRKGEPLLDLYSPELVSTQEEYLQALRYEKQMAGSTVGEARSGAVELAQSAKRRLQYWDIPEREIDAIAQRGTPQKTMTFYSPFDGYVIDKMVYDGQNVMAGMDLYRIADLSTVWIIAEIYQYELPWVKVGQEASVELSYLPGRKFKGRLTYIYPTLNTETKTARVRIAVRNTPGLEFKPEMFATVEIASPVSVKAVAVPDQAIIRSGPRNVAVIALGGGYFDPREVTLGVSAEGYVQILKGVKAGEKIVVSSQFLIDSESNLKAAIAQMSSHADSTAMPMNSTPAAEDTTVGMTTMQKVTDPVCGMRIMPKQTLSVVYSGTKYFFCSKDDMQKFQKDPEKFALHGEHQQEPDASHTRTEG
jgi:Cu(I)/Ag(I) efflux system membrane fusion protein